MELECTVSRIPLLVLHTNSELSETCNEMQNPKMLYQLQGEQTSVHILSFQSAKLRISTKFLMRTRYGSHLCGYIDFVCRTEFTELIGPFQYAFSCCREAS